MRPWNGVLHFADNDKRTDHENLLVVVGAMLVAVVILVVFAWLW
jgi:hypothetical protein